jgi:glycosyltransferase involved in cell wall biosynthesis
MIAGKKIVVVMPAYNAASTLRATLDGLDREQLDHVILVDDASGDETAALAEELGLQVHVHPTNRGYGANQKTCYRLALDAGADVVVMVHPDYQYEPRLAAALASMVATGVYDCALGSRMLGRGALAGGMPLHKFLANKALTFIQNLCTGENFSEYHTGFRAFSREMLLALPLEHNSDGFQFDNQILAQAIMGRYRIGEMSVPTRYFPEASSIGLADASRYAVLVVLNSLELLGARLGLPVRRYLKLAAR